MSGVPQLLQNASPAITGSPQLGQRSAGEGGAMGALAPLAVAEGCTGESGAPHWSQKRAQSGFSAPH
jgi:hypothetical protein